MITKKEDNTSVIECDNCGSQSKNEDNESNTLFVVNKTFLPIDIDLCNKCFDEMISKFKNPIKREKVLITKPARGRPKKDETTSTK